LKNKASAPSRKLPVSVRLVLESLLRNLRRQEGHATANVTKLANWNAERLRATAEIPFVVARIVLQDFTGVPLLVDLAAMRSCGANRMGKTPKSSSLSCPWISSSITRFRWTSRARAIPSGESNLDLEFHRNRERYQFLKWGEQAFDTFKVVPPGIGIVHQVNLEYLAKGVLEKDGI
jgi:aconitate hydratase